MRRYFKDDPISKVRWLDFIGLLAALATMLVTYHFSKYLNVSQLFDAYFHRSDFIHLDEFIVTGTVLFLFLMLFFVYRHVLIVKAGRFYREELNVLDDLTEAAKDAVILIDNKGNVSTWNKAAEKMFDRSREEIFGKELHDILAPLSYRDRYRKAFPQFSATGEGPVIGKTLELTALKKDGKEFPIELSVSSVKVRGKWHAIGIVRDITERKKVLDSLKESEQRFRDVFNGASFGMLLADPDNIRFSMANDRICKMLGYERDELLGLFIQDIHPKKDMPSVMRTFERQKRGEIEVGLDMPVQRKDGSVFYADIGARSLTINGRQQLLGIFVDVTERKKAEAELKKISERMEFVLGATKTGFDIIDEDYNLVYIDPTWARVYGDPTGKKCYAYFMKRDDPCPGCGVTQAIKTGNMAISEEVLVREGNRPIEVITIPFKGEDGRMYAAEINIDITERKKAAAEIKNYQENLEKMVEDKTADLLRREKVMNNILEDLHLTKKALEHEKEDLVRSNRELEQFAYVASHDLQEPLRMVTSYVQLLEKRYRSKLDKDADEFIGFAVEGAKRMHGLINDLLGYSRVGTRGRPFRKVRAEDAIAEALQNLEIQVKHNDAKVIVDKLPEVYADALQLSLIFQNLISNAIKFRLKEPPEIRISAQEGEKEWVFCVRDNGMGFDQKFAEKIFAIFQRLHAKREFEGSGMGLAICKKIVERHKGRIWAESKPGGGAAFYFTIAKKGEESL